MSDTPSYTELQQMRAEAERLAHQASVDRKAAAEVQANAEYMFGQADHRRREIAAIEQGISQRERRLTELNEGELVAREKAADDKLKQAQELMQAYDRDRHAAAISLNQINAREARERGEAA